MSSRKALNALIEDELWDMDVVFSKLIHRNESQPISLKAAKAMVLSKVEESADFNSNVENSAAAVF